MNSFDNIQCDDFLSSDESSDGSSVELATGSTPPPLSSEGKVGQPKHKSFRRMDSSDEAIPESNLAPNGTEESEKWDQEQAEAREQAPKQAEQDPQNEEAQEEDGDGKTLNEEQRASLDQFLGQWSQSRSDLQDPAARTNFSNQDDVSDHTWARQEVLTEALLRTLLEADGNLPPVLPMGTYDHNKSERTIRLHGGGVIYYFGLGDAEDYQKIGSLNLSGCAVDEAVELSEPDWTMLRGRIRLQLKGLPMQLYGACNPGAPSHHLAKRFGLAGGHQPAGNCMAIQTRSPDNFFLPKQYVEDLMSLEGVAFERYVEGKWRGGEGLVYDRFDRSVHVRERDEQWRRIVVGQDEGYTNPAALVAIGEDGDGRLHILGKMNEVIAEPRPDLKPHAPRIVELRIDKSYIGAVIGPGGKIIQEIQASTGTTINIEEVGDEGVVSIASPDKASIDAAVERIKEITFTPEVGDVYDAVVKTVMPYGVFVEFSGKSGLLHVTEMSHSRIDRVDEVFSEGDPVKVKLIGVDKKTGKFRLSRKALMPLPEGMERRDDRRDGGDRRRGGGDRHRGGNRGGGHHRGGGPRNRD